MTDTVETVNVITLKQWKTFLDSPVAAHPVRTVGEDEFRFVGSVSASGLNLMFGNTNTPVDLEILEITIQPQAQVNATITIGGVPVSGTWTLSALQVWSSPGFILERGKQIVLFLSAAVAVNFEVRWRLYYGRQV
jgi:hypothetical protein